MAEEEEMRAWVDEFELRQARWAFRVTDDSPLKAMWRDDWRESSHG
jgi:hypothetical protein